jgi:pimeloyl-ACP methyl ester carboxylesterase
MYRAAVLAVLAAGFVAGGTTAPDGAAHPCVRGNELWFRAADRTRLVGHRFGAGTTAIILAHQSGASDLCEWVPYARALAEQGYFVFPFDFRNHGFSQRRRYNASLRLPGDVAAAARALRRLGKQKILLVGSSMGGIASLVAAANVRAPVDGVVSLSAPARYRALNAVPSVARLRLPVLYISAENDDDGRFATDARRLYAATATTEKRLEIVPGELHGVELLEQTAEVRELVERFLRSR